MSDATCPFAIVRDGAEEPCDKPAVCVIRYEWEGETHTDPACAYHANQHGRGAGLQITDHIMDLIITQERIRREPAGAS